MLSGVTPVPSKPCGSSPASPGAAPARPGRRRDPPTSDRVREAMFSMLHQHGRGRGCGGGRPVRRQRGPGDRGAVPGHGGGHVRRQRPGGRDAIRPTCDGRRLGRCGRRRLYATRCTTQPAPPSRWSHFADPPYRFERWAPLLGSLPARDGLLVAETGADLRAGVGHRWETVKVERYGGTVVTVVQVAGPTRRAPRR